MGEPKYVEFDPDDPKGELVLHMALKLDEERIRVDRYMYNRSSHPSEYTLRMGRGDHEALVETYEHEPGENAFEQASPTMRLALALFHRAEVECVVSPRMQRAPK